MDERTSFEKRLDKVEYDSRTIDKVVDSIIKPYIEGLDKYVAFVSSCLQDGEKKPTNEELDDFCLNLSTQLYYASAMSEVLGIRDDIAKALYKEVYHTSRADQTGTVADKNSAAELLSHEEWIVSVCYTNAYRIVKAKVESAQELLSSCKKVLSRRISEQELTRISRN